MRQQLADLRVRYEAARLLNYRADLDAGRGRSPDVEASIARIHNTQLEQLVGHVGLELLGPVGQLRAGDASAPLRGEIHRQWVRNIPTTIAAGTLEIQKNIVARGLGLPSVGMDLSLGEEQRMLADTARAFVDRSCPPEVARALDAGAPEPQLWPIIVDAGWTSLVVPEEHGGAGRGLAEVVVVCEQLGRGPIASPLIATTALAALPLLWLGTDAQRRRWLPELARATRIGTLALLEDGMRDEWDVVGMHSGRRFRARRSSCRGRRRPR